MQTSSQMWLPAEIVDDMRWIYFNGLTSSSATLNGRSEATGDQLPVAGGATLAAQRVRVGCSALFG